MVEVEKGSRSLVYRMVGSGIEDMRSGLSFLVGSAWWTDFDRDMADAETRGRCIW